MENVKFENLQLYPEILKAVKYMGFEEASPIQAQAIPIIIEGKDIIGQAQTGTGKTAAFGIPLLQADSLPEKRSADYRRNTRACDGSYAEKNSKNGSDSHRCSGRGR